MQNVLHDLTMVRIRVKLGLGIGSALELRSGLGQKSAILKLHSTFCKLHRLTNRTQH